MTNSRNVFGCFNQVANTRLPTDPISQYIFTISVNTRLFNLWPRCCLLALGGVGCHGGMTRRLDIVRLAWTTHVDEWWTVILPHLGWKLEQRFFMMVSKEWMLHQPLVLASDNICLKYQFDMASQQTRGAQPMLVQCWARRWSNIELALAEHPVHGMVWYGMVWYGMVWYGMVWYGMVWYGMVWYGMVWYGMVWYGMV